VFETSCFAVVIVTYITSYGNGY